MKTGKRGIVTFGSGRKYQTIAAGNGQRYPSLKGIRSNTAALTKRRAPDCPRFEGNYNNSEEIPPFRHVLVNDKLLITYHLAFTPRHHHRRDDPNCDPNSPPLPG